MPGHHLSEDGVTRSAEAFLRVADYGSRWNCWRLESRIMKPAVRLITRIEREGDGVGSDIRMCQGSR
jgi:hypothetical protein